MVYYTGTDVSQPDDELPRPACHDDGFQDRSTFEQGLEAQADSRSRPDADMVDVSDLPPGHHTRPAPTATGGKYGRKREFFVKRLPNGTVTNKYGTPIVIDPPHNAPLPVVSVPRTVPDRSSTPSLPLEKVREHRITKSTAPQPRPDTSTPRSLSILPPRAKPKPTPKVKIKLSLTKKGITADGGLKWSIQQGGEPSNGRPDTKEDSLATVKSSRAAKQQSLMVKLKVKDLKVKSKARCRRNNCWCYQTSHSTTTGHGETPSSSKKTRK